VTATLSTEYSIVSITYTAESASIPGRTYAITVDADGWHCSCKAGEYTKTRGKCWHLRSAQAGELGKPRVRVQPVAPAPAVPLVVHQAEAVAAAAERAAYEARAATLTAAPSDLWA
jgi:hypothetical protein